MDARSCDTLPGLRTRAAEAATHPLRVRVPLAIRALKFQNKKQTKKRISPSNLRKKRRASIRNNSPPPSPNFFAFPFGMDFSPKNIVYRQKNKQ
jgi:hypothetical protein